MLRYDRRSLGLPTCLLKSLAPKILMKTIHRPSLRLRFFTALSALLLSGSTLMAQQSVGFIEDFALAEKREEALKQLIPGTEDYYYYHALHFQNERQLDRLKEILTQWRNRFENSGQRKLIENREALIRYSDDPEATLAYLKKELNLSLNHQQEGIARDANHPSKLDQKLISWKSFLDEARRNSANLSNLDESAFYLFLESKPKLTSNERRDLLARATLPDLPNLLENILTDLKSKESRGFGEFSIHRALTKLQLEQLLEGKKDLINHEAYVQTYLAKLLPGADENLASSPEVREAYLDRAWKFVSTLAPSFTSLKAHLLYQRLVHDRALGKENQKRFLTYLALPRNVSYLNPEWRKNNEVPWRSAADLGRDFRSVTTLPPVGGGDEALVKNYLLHFLKDAKDSKKFAPYLRESWLRAVFAESKITNGVGKPADWASLLSPSQFQALKDRVDIEFDPTSPEVYSLDDEATLKVHLKNVPKLIIKVFEINTLNYYRNRKDEVSTDIELDGLVANHVEVHEYKEAPQLRHLREFKIPSIEKRRGLWVVEFIGGGKSSRAVIRKGSLGILTRSLPKGELITVLDEKHQPAKGAGVWIGERRYDCDDKGRALLPFSNNPGQRTVVIEDAKGLATLARITQPKEAYQLKAGIHLDQEALRTGGKAEVLIRPTLTVAGQTVSLASIESSSLSLTSINLDGVPASTSVQDFKLMSDREAVHEFSVPDRVTQITATLKVKIKVASQGGKEIELSDSRTFTVNQTLASQKVGDLFLSQIDGRYRVEYLGRNGEALAGQNLSVKIHHRGFKNHRNVTLKTNKVGGVDLGELTGIRRIEVSATGNHSRDWFLHQDRRDQVGLHTLVAGQDLKIPFVDRLQRSELAFFSYSKGGYVTDEFSRLKVNKGYLVAPKLPAGDYRLILKPDQRVIQISVAEGTVSKGHVFNGTRMLELPIREPSHLAQIKTGKETLEIQVEGLDDLTRVHVVATRFLPRFAPMWALGGSQRTGLTNGRGRYLPSLYISGRNLGDELRYILERRYAQKFVGNMLVRPEILLNPWAIRDTESGEENLTEGDRFARKPVPTPASLRRTKGKAQKSEEGFGAGEPAAPSYEFLAHDPVTLPNLIPDENGKLSIKLDAFGDRQHIHVLLVDPDGSTYRSVSLPDRQTKLRDLRLIKALDPMGHFTEQESVTLLKKGDSLTIPGLLNAEFEVFDHLGAIHRYFLNLKNDATLREFSFVTNWPSLADAEKKEKYSKYACHELSFFLSRKDPEFFKSVVLPHLANKKDRTFMDDYLLAKPLEKYLEPYQYARLNVVERLLLLQSDPKGLANLALDLEHRLALKAPNPGQAQLFFSAAVGGGAFGDGYAGKKVDGTLRELSESGMDDPFGGVTGAALGEPGEAERRSLSFAKKAKERVVQEAAIADLASRARGKNEEAPADAFMVADEEMELLERAEQLYRSLEPTKEWAENNYYKLRISQQNYELIDENQFWLDLAKLGLKPNFGSRHLGEATGNFAEMMLALSFLDLPFESPKHDDEVKDGDLNFTAGGNALLFHREVKEADMAEKTPPLIVSQSFLQADDRFIIEDGEKVDKFITGEFVRGIVYASQIVVTNPTSSSQRLDLLTQIPKGAIPVFGQRSTKTHKFALQPYTTHRIEVAFYFPLSGEFPVYPALLSKGDGVIAHAGAFTCKVLDEPSKIDKTSWAWMSQWGEEGDVLKYLQSANLHAIDLTKVAWRCRESADFFKQALDILDKRGIYQPVLQSYALVHNSKDEVAQYLLMQAGFLNQCGLALSSDLITFDPIDRRNYEHLEYKPLINNRAHALGGENRILNPVVLSQYQQFLTILSQQKALGHRDHLAATYYLFLQDRVGEAIAHLAKVDGGKLDTQMQFDYFQAYAAFYQADLGKARGIAKKYEKYPVDRWRERFASITAQLAEVEGAGPEVVDEGNREQEQEAAASREPTLALKIEGVKATLDYQNLTEVTVNYYEMDLEFLFSTAPFVSSGTSRFSIIQPNKSVTMKLPKGKTAKGFALPKEYQASNVIVEVIGGGKKTSKAVYANELRTTLSESMGLLSVRHEKTGKPLSKVYVKVYAKTSDGVKFFKDGYTDLRGKFDYASVSSTGLGKVERFSILIMSEDHGATVEEAEVPQR